MACHKVAESHNFSLDDVQDSLATDGFTVSRIVVEAEGVCAHCHEGENA
jgi:Fe2+ or Zn2+ uptake regulation protein